MHGDYTTLFIGARKMSLLLFMLAHKSLSTFNATTNLSASLGYFVFENISMLTTDVTLSQDSLEHRSSLLWVPRNSYIIPAAII